MKKEKIDYKNIRLKNCYDSIWKNVGKCVFCDLKAKYILIEENEVVLTMNLFPYINGHMMAIPKRHIRSPKELTNLEWKTIKKFSYIAKKIIKKELQIKSMWILIREGGVNSQMSVPYHLHVHFLPVDSADFVKWNYREITVSPKDFVQKVSKKYIENLSAKYEKKYSNL